MQDGHGLAEPCPRKTRQAVDGRTVSRRQGRISPRKRSIDPIGKQASGQAFFAAVWSCMAAACPRIWFPVFASGLRRPEKRSTSDESVGRESTAAGGGADFVERSRNGRKRRPAAADLFRILKSEPRESPAPRSESPTAVRRLVFPPARPRVLRRTRSLAENAAAPAESRRSGSRDAKRTANRPSCLVRPRQPAFQGSRTRPSRQTVESFLPSVSVNGTYFEHRYWNYGMR